MSDQELIERLLDGYNLQPHDGYLAADRIEDLVKERDDAEKRETLAADMAVKYLERAEQAEAKLAKAMEALRTIEVDCDADYPPSHGAIKYAIRAVLAELEGKDHG